MMLLATETRSPAKVLKEKAEARVPASNGIWVSFIQDSSLRFEKQSRAVGCSLKWHSVDMKIHWQ